MMTETSLNTPRSILPLIWIPAVISLGVTLLRLTGELRHWSERWFSRETGGTDPHGMSWLIGITWLAVPFGVYFALRLARAGLGPRSAGRVALFDILGLALIFCSRFLFVIFPGRFPELLIPLWLCWVAAAALQFFGWPSLSKTLLAYALAALATVVCVPLTGNLKWAAAPGNVAISAADTGLPKDSVADVSQIVTVDKAVLTERAGTVRKQMLALVFAGIDVVLGK